MLYISCASSFISSQFLALPLDGWFGVLFKKLIIDVPLLYYFINIRSSIIFCFSVEDIYLSWGISLSCSFVSVSALFCSKSLSAISLTIKSPVAFAVFFFIAFFEAVLSASVANCLVWSRSFWMFYHSSFYSYGYGYFYPFILQKTKILTFYKISISWLNWTAHNFLHFALQLITNVYFVFYL